MTTGQETGIHDEEKNIGDEETAQTQAIVFPPYAWGRPLLGSAPAVIGLYR
jgi:hypothetical protein